MKSVKSQVVPPTARSNPEENVPPGNLRREVEELVRAVESLKAEEEKAATAQHDDELLVNELGENLDKKSVSRCSQEIKASE